MAEGIESVKVIQSCLTLCNPVDYTYTVHGILQTRILEWVAIFLLQGIFPTQGSNPGLPHSTKNLYQLSHQEVIVFICCVIILKLLDVSKSAPSTGKHEWLFYLNDWNALFSRFNTSDCWVSLGRVALSIYAVLEKFRSSCLLVKPFFKRTSPGSCLKIRSRLTWHSGSTTTWEAGGLAVIFPASDAPKHGV